MNEKYKCMDEMKEEEEEGEVDDGSADASTQNKFDMCVWVANDFFLFQKLMPPSHFNIFIIIVR